MSVGYMKPLGRLPQKKDELTGDADALVVQEVLGQSMPADVLSPLMMPQTLHALALAETDAAGAALRRIAECYARIAEGKDLVLVSGTGAFPAAGRFASADGLRLVRALGLKTLLVERFVNGRINYDELLLCKDALDASLLGIVLNDVPETETRNVKKWLSPWLKEHDISLLGVLGHEPDLLAMRVADLAHGLNGRVVAGSSGAARMVNGFVIGAMQVDNFMMYLRRKAGCAVIVGGDRSDLQLAALHSNCPCIILTCNMAPSELIRSKAESMGVTLMTVRDDTYTVARNMARMLRSKKLRDLSQIRIAISLTENGLDLQEIFDRI
jgi:BioD-like phosphotransacetylase family protein